MAEALGLELQFDEWAKETLEARFQGRNITINERQLRQCYKPEGAELITNAMGTAPGIRLKKDGKLLIMLPGPPHELNLMFENEVLPKLQMEGYTLSHDAFLQLRSFGIPEGEIEDYIHPVLKDYPDITTAICASKGLVDIRISPKSGNMAWQKLKRIGVSCADSLGENFICYGHCSIAHYVLEQLRAMEKTIATAESCTGGLLSSAFTDVPGASKVFSGGAVCYCNDAKVQMLEVPECILQQHGAVSAEVAAAMATGTAERHSTDYGLSITGYAGPDGGTADNPVGTLYLGYHSPAGVWADKVVLPGDRLTVKARGVNAALDLVRRKLAKYKLVEFLCMDPGHQSDDDNHDTLAG